MSTTLTTTIQPIPLIAFNGNCEEAMNYYAEVFGGKINVMMKAGESPIGQHMPPEFSDKILNAQVGLPGGGLLMGGDCPPHVPYEGLKGFHLGLNYDSIEDAEAMFNKLAEGGEINMPMGPTFWATRFGMVTDKFGVAWAINGDLQIR